MNNFQKSKENHKLNSNVHVILHQHKADLQPVSLLYHNINLILNRHKQPLSQVYLLQDLLIFQHKPVNPLAIRLHTKLLLS
jgi:hypothetical protein